MPQQVPQQLQVVLGTVELRGPQGDPAPDRVLGDFTPCRVIALPQAGELGAARREHRLPQRGPSGPSRS
ncbi:hypothetical protein [Streptomyces sp. DH-12]|uniref:hypothetical protein n=1 Tax=Streptomyces sp. DH-12 TaxID=2072509 RepID=UPI001F536ACE|nr:hypothetical protein [Streptomyces sp. DH-12]